MRALTLALALCAAVPAGAQESGSSLESAGAGAVSPSESERLPPRLLATEEEIEQARRQRRPERVLATPEEMATPAAPRGPPEWFVLPLIGYTSDQGFGGALLGMIFLFDGEHRPYRDRVQLVTSLSSKLFMQHELRWERVGLFGAPLRLTSALGFRANPVGHYCGVGNGVTCDRNAAEEAARNADLPPDGPGYRRFVRRYYRWRSMRAYAELLLRWEPVPGSVELTLEWRGVYNVPGYPGQMGAYAGSLFAEHFPQGERGFQSELRVGAVLDRRDNERRPTSGFVVAGSVRGAGVVTGSRWDYVGLNLAGSTYVPVVGDRLIWASRAAVDLLIGDAPTYVLGSIGGFWSDVAFGGPTFGRGIRQRRYIGRIKVLGQTELRVAIARFPRSVDWTGQLFVDAAWLGADYADFGGSLRRILVSFGGGTGLTWGQQFVLRFDVGLSPHEAFKPQFYISLVHPF